MELRKLLPLSGIVFVVVVVLGVAVLGADTPPSTASGGELLQYYDEHQVREAVASFIFAATVPFLVLFAVTLATALWPVEPGPRPVWEIVMIGGSVLTGAVILVTAAVHFALTDGATNNASPDGLQALALVDGNTWVAFNAGLGVMMLGAAGALIPRLGVYRWLGWVALVLGVALFIPFADFIALLLTLVWILVVSALLFRAPAEAPPRVAATG
jgi:hypothetical protein